MHDFHTEVEIRGEQRTKMQSEGIWPHYRYPGRRLISIIGDLLGNDSSDFNSKRISDLNILMPTAGVIQRQRKYGMVRIKFTGQGEYFRADVSLDDYPSYPLEGLSPSRCTYEIAFLSFLPYLIGEGSGRFYYI
jgi:hypothetical protein